MVSTGTNDADIIYGLLMIARNFDTYSYIYVGDLFLLEFISLDCCELSLSNLIGSNEIIP